MFTLLSSARHLLIIATLLLLASCGGGGGNSTPPATFTISVNVSGLKGSAVLQNNGVDNLTISSNKTVAFANPAANYNVTVSAQPLSGQTCAVTNGSGTATANVSNINIACTDNTASRYVYVVDGIDNNIATYVIDNVSGRPKYINKLSISTSPSSITIDPSGTHAYVLSSANGSVAQYTIGRNGVLTAINSTTPVLAGTNPASLTIDPLGRFAYVVNASTPPSLGDISAYTIDPVTGALAQINCVGSATTTCNTNNFQAGMNPKHFAIDPTGKFAYAINSGSNASGTDADISAYSIDQNTGALTQIDCGSGTTCNTKNFKAGVYPQRMVIDPKGQHAYVVNSYNNLGGNSISQYNITATGALSAITPANVPTGNAPYAMTLDSSGKYAYVVNSFNGTGGNSVSQYSIDAISGALTAMATSTVATGLSPQAIVADRLGKSIYVTNTGSNTISTFNIGSTGALTPGTPATVPTYSNPLSVGLAVGNTATQAVPQYAYAVNYGFNGSSSIKPYTINATNGQLSSITGTTAPVGVRPSAIAVDPSGKYAYVANTGIGTGTADNNISQYSVNSDGTLTALNPATVNVQNPSAIAIDPLGRYVYVTIQNSTSLSQFSINADGTLVAMSPALVATAPGPSSVAIDPSGQYVYVTNRDSGSTKAPVKPYQISQYRIGTNGTLSAMSIPTVTSGAEPNAIAIDATGQYAYVVNRGGIGVNGSISQFRIGATDGALSSSGPDVTTGITPLSIAVDISGHVYVASTPSKIAGTLYQYTTTPTGTISPTVATIATGTTPYSIAIDPLGKYAYVANQGTNDLSQYVIGTTALTPNGTISAGSDPYCIITTGTWQ